MADWVESDGKNDGGLGVGMEMMVWIGLEWVNFDGLCGNSD